MYIKSFSIAIFPLALLLCLPISGYLTFALLLIIIALRSFFRFFLNANLLVAASTFFSFSYLSHQSSDSYIVTLFLQILIISSLLNPSNKQQLKRVVLFSLLISLVYIYQAFVPSLFIYGFWIYQDIFSLITVSTGSSVIYSNMSSLCFLVSYVCIYLNVFNEIRLKSYLICSMFLSILPGFCLGSRTFLLVFLTVTIHYLLSRFNIRKFFIYLCISPVFLVFLPLLQSSRLFTDGLSSSRYIAWERAYYDYGLFGLNQIRLIDHVYYVSAFHNFIFDGFLYYGSQFLPLLLLLVFFLILFFYQILRAKINLSDKAAVLFLPTFLLTILCTTVVWRADTNIPVMCILYISFIIHHVSSYPQTPFHTCR